MARSNKQRMICEFLDKKNFNPARALNLIILGFGQNGLIFRKMFAGSAQTALVYDYRQLQERSGDWNLLETVPEIRVLAWSLGVKLAPLILYGLQNKVSRAVAYNGTVHGISDTKGLPERGYCFLERFLNPARAHKLYLDMTGGREESFFMHLAPLNEIEHLKNELTAIRKAEISPVAFIWQQALIGSTDLIFPPQAQCRAWLEEQVPYRLLQGMPDHYASAVFTQVLDAFTNQREVCLA